MYDYMRACTQGSAGSRSFKKSGQNWTGLTREIKARLDLQDQETLLQLADLENELREETS